MARKYPSLLERLLANSFVSSEEAHEGSWCWLWIGAVGPNGYGKLNLYRDGKHVQVYAHRAAFEEFKGHIRNEVDHLCGVRNCINPAHLEDVSHYENLLRRDERRRTRNNTREAPTFRDASATSMFERLE